MDSDKQWKEGGFLDLYSPEFNYFSTTYQLYDLIQLLLVSFLIICEMGISSKVSWVLNKNKMVHARSQLP